MTMFLAGLLGVAAASGTEAGAVATPPPPPLPSPNRPVSDAELALGQRLASQGELHSAIGAMTHGEIARLLEEAGRVPGADLYALRRIAHAREGEMRSRLTRDIGMAYARRLSIEEMSALLNFFESPAGRAYVAALPQIRQDIAKAIGTGAQFRAQVVEEYCRTTGKLCGSRR